MATLYQPLFYLFNIAIAVEAQTAVSVTPNKAAQLGAAKEQVAHVLTVVRQYGASPTGWIGETGSPPRADIDRMLADEYLSVDEAGQRTTKADVLRTCCRPEAAEFAKRFAIEAELKVEIKDLDITLYGNTAVAQYKNEARLVFNKEPVVKTFNCTEVLVNRDGRWQSVMHTQTVMPGEIVGMNIDRKVYGDYVGKYRLTSDVVYTVRRAGDKLLWDSDHSELLPESETTFLKKSGFPDVLFRIIFVRNDEGRVTHVRIREFPGVEYSAVRIE